MTLQIFKGIDEILGTMMLQILQLSIKLENLGMFVLLARNHFAAWMFFLQKRISTKELVKFDPISHIQ